VFGAIFFKEYISVLKKKLVIYIIYRYYTKLEQELHFHFSNTFRLCDTGIDYSKRYRYYALTFPYRGISVTKVCSCAFYTGNIYLFYSRFWRV
jgi:hypothetical protein